MWFRRRAAVSREVAGRVGPVFATVIPYCDGSGMPVAASRRA